jgi:hypothetical protein
MSLRRGTAAALVAVALVLGAAACGDESPTVTAPGPARERASAPGPAAAGRCRPTPDDAEQPTMTSEDCGQVPPLGTITPGTNTPVHLDMSAQVSTGPDAVRSASTSQRSKLFEVPDKYCPGWACTAVPGL